MANLLEKKNGSTRIDSDRALTAWQQEAEARLVESLLAELDPELEPEREAAECTAIVEAGLKEMEAGHNLVSFEEACRRWEEEKAARQAAKRA